jgi:hypothetical protein
LTTLLALTACTCVARGFGAQLVAVVPDLRIVVAVGAVPTEEYSIPNSDVSFLLTDVIVPALDKR